ncbi:MAG TPA: hypothetical protein VMH48_06910 [Methylomirabilota bacterium]|nr:hypothetical protein [Methylomirabilota bacterium]
MNKRDYLEKRKEIQQDCADKLEALDKVFVMFGGTPVGADANEAAASGNEWAFEVSKREAVRLALSKLPVGIFTTKDVRVALDRDYAEYSKRIDDNQISAIVSWLASKGQISIHTRKYGSAPAKYEKKAAPEETMKAKAG